MEEEASQSVVRIGFVVLCAVGREMLDFEFVRKRSSGLRCGREGESESVADKK